MKRISRTERTQRTRSERARRMALVLAVVGAVGLLGTVVAVLVTQGASRAAQPVVPLEAEARVTPSSVTTGSVAATSTPELVEVPDVVGRSLAEAEVVLEAAGLTVKVVETAAAPADAIAQARMVLDQEPAGKQLVPAGTSVLIVVPAEAGVGGVSAAGGADVSGRVVCIDPGHQSRGDNTREPIGPGSSETKPRVTGGTTGVQTRIAEYEVVLQISMNLKARLEAAGVTVVMTRDTNDVSISNAERARMANEAGAQLFVRVHADGSTDPSRAGISTLYPGANQWTGAVAGPSERAARLVQEAVVASTAAADLGVVPRSDLSGFNWAAVPSILVECGFMSNPVEDKLLSSPHYQDKLAEGMAAGIIAYLGE